MSTAELDYEGWRLSVQPKGVQFEWWILSPAPAHSIIKHDIDPSFQQATYTAYRTLQGLIGKPLPPPLITETP